MRKVTVSNEQFDRLQALAEIYHTTPDQIVSAWLDAMLAPAPHTTGAPSLEEYDRRWRAFVRLVGSIRQGKLLTDEEVAALIGEAAVRPHDAKDTDSG
jgi:hypothetical protein